MADKKVVQYLKYMRAHLRARDGRCAGELSNDELYDAFHIMRPPEIGFEQWRINSGQDIDPEKPEAPESEPAASVDQQNAAGLSALVALQKLGAPVELAAGDPKKPAESGNVDRSLAEHFEKQGISANIKIVEPSEAAPNSEPPPKS